MSGQWTTPLHAAAARGDEAEAMALIRAGAPISAVDISGLTPARAAALEGHAELAGMIASGGSLADACRHGDLAAAKRRIEAGEDINAAGGDWGAAPISAAAASGCVEAIGFLLGHGASALAPDRRGLLPIHHAARRGHAEAIRALAAASGVDACGPDGMTAFHYAAEATEPPVRVLLALGADKGAMDRKGMTALHHFARRNRPEAVRECAAAGADIEARSALGRTPAHEAADFQCLEALLAIMEAGGAVNAATSQGDTVLHRAAARADPACVVALLAHGADREARNAARLRPIDVARRNRRHAAVEALS